MKNKRIVIIEKPIKRKCVNESSSDEGDEDIALDGESGHEENYEYLFCTNTPYSSDVYFSVHKILLMNLFFLSANLYNFCF